MMQKETLKRRDTGILSLLRLFVSDSLITLKHKHTKCPPATLPAIIVIIAHVQPEKENRDTR